MVLEGLRAVFITMALMAFMDLIDVGSDQHAPRTTRDSSAHDDDDDHGFDAVDGQLHTRKNTYVRPWIIGANSPGWPVIAGAAI